MTDRRLTPANARVAADHLRDQVDAPRFSKGEDRQLSVPVADLLNAPRGKRDRQLLRGEDITLYDDHDGWSFVQVQRDGYVGYLRSDQLMRADPPTHRVKVRATHVYSKPDLKSADRVSLSHLSRVQVLGEIDRFAKLRDGFVPHVHLEPLTQMATDPVAVAELYLGTPYLWGGNSGFGIDCSGLIQAGCRACGIDCPGDSDMQEAGLGTPLAGNASLRRGDLVFWKGHVAWVADETRLIHANAFHMAVTFENIDTAITRIAAQGDGPVTARKRLGGHS